MGDTFSDPRRGLIRVDAFDRVLVSARLSGWTSAGPRPILAGHEEVCA